MAAPGETPIFITKDQLVEAIEAGAEARERTDTRRGLRWFLLGMLAGFVSAAAIAIPVQIILAGHARDVSRADAATNCSNITGLAKIERERFAKEQKQTTEFEAKSKDRFGLSPKDFASLILANRSREKERLDKIEVIANTNCSSVIR